MPALSSRSYVHLLPECIGGSREYPVYAKVTKVEGDAVQLSGLHDAADAAWTISRANALAGLVSAREVGSAREGSLLRRAVVLMVNDHFSHGQVVAVKDQCVTVRLGSEEVVMRASQVSEVAPVVALLFQEVVFDATEWSLPELNAVQGEVLDRILGTDEHLGFRDIPSILEGIVDGAVHPTSDSIVSWMDPRTGGACEFPLQQAIDYAYFVDGNVHPIPASVGPSFCRSSARSDRSTPAENHPPQPCNSMFNHQFDDDEGGIAEQGASPSPHELAPPASSSGKRIRLVAVDDAQQLSTKRPAHAAATDDRQQDESIAAMLLDRPDLLQRFLSIRSGSSQRQASDMIHQRHDCQDDDGASRVNRSSKYGFAPTPAQRRVHARITASNHQGTLPFDFVEGLINSPAVLFKPHPSILVRVFDFQFGVRGLSVLHFKPFLLADKVDWLTKGGSNMQNFSPSATFSSPSSVSSVTEIAAAAQILGTYANEFFTPVLRDLINTMTSFIQSLSSRHTWDAEDLPQLVYWVNSVFEQFRIAMEHGDTDGSAIKLRCSTDDSELRNIMYALQARQIQRLRAATSPPGIRVVSAKGNTNGGNHSWATPTTRSGVGHTGRMARVKSEFHISPEISALIPVKDGKSLCLKFLSSQGCKSSRAKHCVVPSRGHFVPDQLDERVRTIIEHRFGGLQAAYASL